MTTIAYKDGVVAADGRMCRGQEIIAERYEKITAHGDAVVGVVGNTAAGKAYEMYLDTVSYFGKELDFVTFMKERPWADFLTEDDGEVIVFFPTHIEVHCYHGIIKTGLEQCAFGSGSPFALSAMVQGLSPIQAVKHAAILDAGTNTYVISRHIGPSVDS